MATKCWEYIRNNAVPFDILFNLEPWEFSRSTNPILAVKLTVTLAVVKMSQMAVDRAGACVEGCLH